MQVCTDAGGSITHLQAGAAAKHTPAPVAAESHYYADYRSPQCASLSTRGQTLTAQVINSALNTPLHP